MNEHILSCHSSPLQYREEFDQLSDRCHHHSSRQDYHSRCCSPIQHCSLSRLPSCSHTGSLPTQYLRSGSFHQIVDPDQDFPDFLNTSLSQRGNMMISEVGKLLLFPPPSPKETIRPSFLRDSARRTPSTDSAISSGQFMCRHHGWCV